MHERAMSDYAAALQIEPNNASIWVARGNELRKHLELDAAIADFTRAVLVDPKYTPAYIERGNVWKQKRAFDKAIQEFSGLVRIDPQNAMAHQSLARVLAACYDAHFRNGKWARDEAIRACELTAWQDPDCLDTLAAACAETGDFSAAVKWQTLAVRLVRQNVPSLLKSKAEHYLGAKRGVDFEDRLTFYKTKRPLRE
jgi:tetratricopeptide (TPR) repeat protein